MNRKGILLILGALVITMIGCGRTPAAEDVNYEKLDVEYVVNTDGTYSCRNTIFKYKTEVTGTDGDRRITYVILTNELDTAFDDVSYSLRTSKNTTGVPEFVILGWHE